MLRIPMHLPLSRILSPVKDRTLKHPVAIITYLAILAVVVFFFHTGQLSEGYFTFLFCALILAGLALYGFDRLKEVNLRKLTLVLNEVEQTKQDVFAKAAEVRSVMVELAESYLRSAAETGRWAATEIDQAKLMIEKRNLAQRLMEKAGMAQQDIREKVDPINRLIVQDLALDIEYDSYLYLLEERKSANGALQPVRQIGEIDEDFRGIVNTAKSHEEMLDMVGQFLRNKGIPDGPFSQKLQHLRYFVENGELPKEARDLASSQPSESPAPDGR